MSCLWVGLERHSASSSGDKAVLAVFCIQANVPFSIIITPGLLHSQQKPKAWGKGDDSDLPGWHCPGVQQLGTSVPGEWGVEWVFSHEGGTVPGAVQRMFLLQKHRVGLAVLVALPSELRPATLQSGAGWAAVLAGSSSPGEETAGTNKHVCARHWKDPVKDPFAKGLKSENITAVVSLPCFYVERPFSQVLPGEVFTCCLYIKSRHLCCGSCKFIFSIFLLFPLR